VGDREKMISSTDIIERLDLSPMALEMAIYSGRLPPPNEDGEWENSRVLPYLENWERVIDARRPRVKEEPHADFIKSGTGGGTYGHSKAVTGVYWQPVCAS
jgi:hypothetical protein